jgi:hypothetical protein
MGIERVSRTTSTADTVHTVCIGLLSKIRQGLVHAGWNEDGRPVVWDDGVEPPGDVVEADDAVGQALLAGYLAYASLADAVGRKEAAQSLGNRAERRRRASLDRRGRV